MNKKLLLGLGGLISIVSPISVVMSCSSSTSDEVSAIDDIITYFEKGVFENRSWNLPSTYKKENLNRNILNRGILRGVDVSISDVAPNDDEGTLDIVFKAELNGKFETSSYKFKYFLTTEQNKINKELNVFNDNVNEFEVKNKTYDEVKKALDSKKISEIEKYIPVFPKNENDKSSIFSRKLDENNIKIPEVGFITFSDVLYGRIDTNKIYFTIYYRDKDKQTTEKTIIVTVDGIISPSIKDGEYKWNENKLKDKLNEIFKFNFYDDSLVEQMKKYSVDKLNKEIINKIIFDNVDSSIFEFNDVKIKDKNFVVEQNPDVNKHYQIVKNDIEIVKDSADTNNGSIEIELKFKDLKDNNKIVTFKARIWGFAWGENKVPQASESTPTQPVINKN